MEQQVDAAGLFGNVMKHPIGFCADEGLWRYPLGCLCSNG